MWKEWKDQVRYKQQKQSNLYTYEGQYRKQSLAEFPSEGFILNASRPDNIAVVKRGTNVRLEVEKKERPRDKPRKVTEIEATGDLVANHINVVRHNGHMIT